MKKNLLKVKIETIAKKLFNNNQILNNDLKEETNINQLSSDESTIKDSLSEFEEISKSINHQKNKRHRNKKNSFLKKPSHASIQTDRQQSSLCTKMTSLTEHNSINEKFDNDCNKQNDKNNNETLQINKLNIYKLNNLKNVYLELLELFNSKKNQLENTKETSKEISDDIKLLSYKYIKYIFSEDMEILINIFNNITEVYKFFIIEIYFFVSIIYLLEEKTLSNNYLLISYKSATFYSISNFDNIINMVNSQNFSFNDKLIMNIKSINKILLPILKIINPSVPSSSQIKEFISPINIKNNKSNQVNGILKLISLLKENDNLNDKLNKLKDIEDNKKRMELIKMEIEEQEKEFIFVLPPMDTKKYKFSIVIELDETLVHYCEENENYYAKVRYGSENFLKNISNFFEIIIVSTSGKEYSNIIIDNLNKDDKCYVEHRIFIEDFNENQSLSDINRDMRKTLFVCHDYDFISSPKNNSILLKEFLGEEEDREIVKLYSELKEFMNHFEEKNDEDFDIRSIVPQIMERINLNIGNLEYLDEIEESENENEEYSNNYKDKNMEDD